MKSVWSPFNPSNVTQMGVCPALLPMLHSHGGPVRTWGPDSLLKLSNVIPDPQLKKIYRGGFMNEALKEDNSTDTHTQTHRHPTRTASLETMV